jgi:hypothetical protein
MVAIKVCNATADRVCRLGQIDEISPTVDEQFEEAQGEKGKELRMKQTSGQTRERGQTRLRVIWHAAQLGP